jgi:hypothetical protein
MMDFSARLDALQQRAVAAREAVQAAVTEPREQREQRIDKAQGELHQAVQTAPQQADQGTGARSKWAQMKADGAAKMEDTKAKMAKRRREMDAKAAATDADWAETDAVDALDFAMWAVDNAQLAMLDAIDARAYADELGKPAGS